MNTHPEYGHEQTLYSINICQHTGLIILCNKNPTFFPLFYDPVLASRHRKKYHFPVFFWKQISHFGPN